MAQSTLNAKVRKRTGKTGVKEVRKEGMVPAILYGKDSEPIALSVNPKELKEALKTESGINTLLELKFTDDGNDYNKVSLLREVQIDPISSDPIHLDFQILEMDQEIVVEIPIELEGRPIGVRDGGVLMENLREIEISCLPNNIPSSITLDISELNIGDSIFVKDLNLGEGIEALKEEDEVVVSVVQPREMDLGDTTDLEEAAAEGEEGVEGEEKAEGAEEAADEGEDSNEEEEG